MSDFNKYFNDRLQDHQSNNDDLNSEALWNDISNELDRSATTPPFWMFSKWIIIALAFVLGGLIATYAYYTDSDLENTAPITTTTPSNKTYDPSTESPATRSKTVETTKNETTNKDSEFVDNETITTRSQSEIDVPSLSGNNAPRENNHPTINSGDAKNNTQETAAHLNTPRENWEVSKMNFQKGNRIKFTSNKNSQSTDNQTTTANTPKLPISESAGKLTTKSQSLNAGSTKNKPFEATGLLSVPIQPITSIGRNDTPELLAFPAFETSTSVAANWQFSASITGGANRTNIQFKTSDSDLAKAKNAAETSGWGSSYAVLATASYKHKWLITSGLEYHQNWTVLKFNSEEINRIDTVGLSYFLDERTLEVLRVDTVNTQLAVTTNRQVTHHNSYRNVAIPILVGRQFNHHHWSVGVQSGPVFRVSVSQNGRTINGDSSLPLYASESDFVPFNSLSVHWRLGGSIEYALSPKVKLIAQPQFTWQPFRKQPQQDWEANLNQLNLNLGIRRTF